MMPKTSFLVLALIVSGVDGFVTPITKISQTASNRVVVAYSANDISSSINENKEVAGGVFATLIAGVTSIFTRRKSKSSSESTTSSTSSSSPPVDLSIPYDAAARLAYDDFCKENSSKDDIIDFESFKPLYLTLTSSEIALKSATSKLSSLTNGEAEAAAKDLSIPYDAAARMAYDEWRVDNKKGYFDEEGYRAFKVIYEMIAVAEVTSKAARKRLEALL